MAEDRRFEWDEPTLAKFAEYHAENPQVYAALKKFALQARRAGRDRLSINMLFERVRWETRVVATGDTFKMNNSFRSYYARLLIREEAELAGFFEIRRSRADAA